jgi:hypothetical protein
MTYDEYAANFREERTRREAEARRHAMGCEEKRVGQAEEDLELVMREYGHVPLSADEITEIAIDECKEMTREDFEKLRELGPSLRGVDECIQTDRTDWFYQCVQSRFEKKAEKGNEDA